MPGRIKNGRFVVEMSQPLQHAQRTSAPDAPRTMLSDIIEDTQAILSWYHGRSPGTQTFATKTLPNWVGQLASASPFAVMAALSQLAWCAGEITVLRPHLHDAHMPHLVAAVLAVARDGNQLMFVRRAAVRAAGLLSPQHAAPRLADILNDYDYREPRELRIAVAEVYVGESLQNVPKVMREAIARIALQDEEKPELIAAAMRAFPYTKPSIAMLRTVARWALKSDDKRVHAAAAEAILVMVQLVTESPAERDAAEEEMLSRLQYRIEMIPHHQPGVNAGLYIAERLGKTLALPMLERLLAADATHPEVRAAVKPVVQRMRAGMAPIEIPDPGQEFNVVRPTSVPERIRTANAEEVLDMWQKGEIAQPFLIYRLRELGPAAWPALNTRLQVRGVRIDQLHHFMDVLGTDAALVFPHIAPHGRDAQGDVAAVRAWHVSAATMVRGAHSATSVAEVRAHAADVVRSTGRLADVRRGFEK